MHAGSTTFVGVPPLITRPPSGVPAGKSGEDANPLANTAVIGSCTLFDVGFVAVPVEMSVAPPAPSVRDVTPAGNTTFLSVATCVLRMAYVETVASSRKMSMTPLSAKKRGSFSNPRQLGKGR